jgi:hypothetical protein
MSDNAPNKKLNEDLRKSYTHERPKPTSNPPQNRENTKPQRTSGSQRGNSGKNK